MAKKRSVSIIERRLESGSVFGASSQPIPLVEPDRWSVRLVNSDISEARIWEMQAVKGWVFATPEDLAVPPEDVGLRVLDGRVVRGTRGAEVLMKMEREDYAKLQRKKEQETRAQTFGEKAVKQSILGAAQAEPDGARGAEFLDRHLAGVTVTDSRERVSLDE